MIVKDILSLMFETKNENGKERILIDDKNCDVLYQGRMELLFNAYEAFIDGDVSSSYSEYYPIINMEVKEMMLGVCNFKGRYFDINLVV